jgi:hypothetical protein
VSQGTAFLAMPYRPELGWVRAAIAAACRRLSIELVSVDERLPTGNIVAGIHYHVRASDFGYVVLTDLNPNVMYELGLLHQASKPTIILADSDTMPKLPFDVRSLMVLSYDATTRDEARLTDQVAAVTGQLLRFFDHAERSAIATGTQPSVTDLAKDVGAPNLRMLEFDFEAIKNRAAKAVARVSCSTSNIVVLDESGFRGWLLKARCSGGVTLMVKIDLNGEPAEIEVRE